MLSDLFILRYGMHDSLLPADKRDQLVRVVCKRKFSLDYKYLDAI